MSPTDLLAGTDTEAAPDTLRADLEAAFSGDTTPAEPETGTDPSPPDDPGPAVAEPPGSAATAVERPRAPDGKFIPKTEAAPSAPVKTEIPSTDTAKAIETPASTPALAPPAGWTAAEKAAWTTLPPAVQAAVSRREQEIQNGGRQWSEEKRRYEGLLGPVAQEAQRRGMSAEQGLNALVTAQRRLDADPVNAIRWLAQSYGVDLATLAGQPSADGSREANPQVDIRALVHQAVQPYVGPIHERMMFEERQRADQATNLVNEFANAPGHENFNAVENEIMAMIPVIKSMNPNWPHEKVLQDAYDRAVYANPATRTSVLESSRQADEAKRQAEAKARISKARTAASSVTGSPIGTQSTAPKDSLRAELEAAFAGG
jgi:hypothetical protein